MASRSTNKAAVPEAKGALDKFKYEVANELGVPLSDGYNGDLTSRQNGSVGGYMVNIIFTEGHMKIRLQFKGYMCVKNCGYITFYWTIQNVQKRLVLARFVILFIR